MPELPPESAVHLKEWKFAHPADARNAGYRRIGDEYVRIDLAERVIKKAHEARGQGNHFGMDMAFATSLGISDAGLKALMRDAGFRAADAPVEVAELSEAVVDEVVAEPVESVTVETEVPTETPTDEAVVAVDPTALQPVILTHWRWVGLPKPRPQEQRPQRARPSLKPDRSPKANVKPDRVPAPSKPASPPSSLALQLAALKGLKL